MSTIKVNLALEEKRQLLTIKRTNKSSLIRDRAQAVLARNEGLTINNIAKALSRSDKFIRSAINLYQQGKIETNNLTSNNYKLNQEKRKEIIELIQIRKRFFCFNKRLFEIFKS